MQSEITKSLQNRKLYKHARREYDMHRFAALREGKKDPPMALGEYRHGNFLPDLTYLVSYPRSGANWLRYCLEAIYLMPTYGVGPQNPLTWLDLTVEDACRNLAGVTLGVDRNDPGLFQHSHRFESAHDSTRILMILRSPKEAILREFRGQYGEKKTAATAGESSINILEFEDGLCDYKNLLEQYHHHKGEKHLIYYEDLLSDPLSALVTFHNDNADFFPTIMGERRLLKRILSFVQNIEEHTKVSVAIYNNGVAKSYTSGEKTSLSQHSNELLSKKERVKWDNHLKKVCDKTIIPYIERYFE